MCFRTVRINNLRIFNAKCDVTEANNGHNTSKTIANVPAVVERPSPK